MAACADSVQVDVQRCEQQGCADKDGYAIEMTTHPSLTFVIAGGGTLNMGLTQAVDTVRGKGAEYLQRMVKWYDFIWKSLWEHGTGEGIFTVHDNCVNVERCEKILFPEGRARPQVQGYTVWKVQPPPCHLWDALKIHHVTQLLARVEQMEHAQVAVMAVVDGSFQLKALDFALR